MASTQVITNGHHHLNNNTVQDGLRHRANGVHKKPIEAQTSRKNGTEDTASMTSAASRSAQALIEVRKRFLEYAEQNPDKVNERDKNKLATDDWYLKRYLLARNRRVDDTLNMLKRTMEWRNEFGVHISEDAMFPLEFYKIGALFPYEPDKEDNLVLYMRIKYHRKIDQMVEVEKHFLVHTFEKIDRITNGQGLVIVFDCQGAGYANCDLEFLQFLIMCATEHAPIGLKYIIVYRLPWVLNAFWSIVKKLLPAYLATRVRFCDEKSIREFIEPKNLPDFVNGSCRRNYRWIPPGCPSVFKLARAHGISDEEVSSILPQFQPLLDEAEEAMNVSSYEDPPETITKYVNNTETAPTLLSDLALIKIGLGSSNADNQATPQVVSKEPRAARDRAAAIIRIFPDEFIEFNYDAYNDVFHATITIFNPSETNSLAFKFMSNRPSNYSVKPARGVLSPDTTLTLSIVLLGEHRSSDKFLVIAQPLEGEIKSISKPQFDSLWAPKVTASPDGSSNSTHTTIRLGSYLRRIVTTPALQTSVKNPQIYELATTCRSLKRRQTMLIILNIILFIFVFNLLYFNQSEGL